MYSLFKLNQWFIAIDGFYLFQIENRLKIIMLHGEKLMEKMGMNIIIIMAVLIIMLDDMHQNKIWAKLLSM